MKMKAFPTINHWPPTNPAPMTIARAAPNPAAEEMPRVKGLARGFLRMPCITAPAMARPMPPTIARRMRCRRKPQTMVSENQSVWNVPGMNLARIVEYTSVTLMSAEPCVAAYPASRIIPKMRAMRKETFFPMNLSYLTLNSDEGFSTDFSLDIELNPPQISRTDPSIIKLLHTQSSNYLIENMPGYLMLILISLLVLVLFNLMYRYPR